MGALCCKEKPKDLDRNEGKNEGIPLPETGPNSASGGTETGSHVCIMVQDSTVDLMLKYVVLPQKITQIPSTEDLIIELTNMSISRIQPTKGSSIYFYNPSKNPAEFDAINTLATVQLVRNMYTRCLENQGEIGALEWRFNKPIVVYPWGLTDNQSYYSFNQLEKETELKFGVETSDRNKEYRHCRSFDIVAHETGHAILDGLKPGILNEVFVQGLALHEAFADLTAVFALLDFIDICEIILKKTGGDLHKASFLPVIGDFMHNSRGLRNLDNNLKIGEVKAEGHALSLVFSGAIYDILVDMYKLYSSNAAISDRPQILRETAHHLLGLTTMACVKAPNQNIQFRDVANNMIALSKDVEIQSLIREHFEKRELLLLEFKPNPRLQYESCVHDCCDSLKELCKEYFK